jgi:hypothetical protein
MAQYRCMSHTRAASVITPPVIHSECCRYKHHGQHCQEQSGGMAEEPRCEIIEQQTGVMFSRKLEGPVGEKVAREGEEYKGHEAAGIEEADVGSWMS